jgi:hypothetical protein
MSRVRFMPREYPQIPQIVTTVLANLHPVTTCNEVSGSRTLRASPVQEIKNKYKKYRLDQKDLQVSLTHVDRGHEV